MASEGLNNKRILTDNGRVFLFIKKITINKNRNLFINPILLYVSKFVEGNKL